MLERVVGASKTPTSTWMKTFTLTMRMLKMVVVQKEKLRRLSNSRKKELSHPSEIPCNTSIKMASKLITCVSRSPKFQLPLRIPQ
jgi:hypothetical protein